MNELGIGLISYHLIFFTDWVPDQNVKSNYGWSMVGLISLFTGLNVIMVVFFGGKGIWLLLVKYYRRIKHKLQPCFKYLNDHLESYRKIEEEAPTLDPVPEMPPTALTLEQLLAKSK